MTYFRGQYRPPRKVGVNRHVAASWASQSVGCGCLLRFRSNSCTILSQLGQQNMVLKVGMSAHISVRIWDIYEQVKGPVPGSLSSYTGVTDF